MGHDRNVAARHAVHHEAGLCTGLTGEARLDIQEKQGHPPFGVEMKVTDDDNSELPWDGKTFGRLKVRGPAVARAYYGGVGTEQFDEEGWFDTGDVAHIDPGGYMQITDRAKDVIKSGGEWISTIELENLAVGHPDVAEAAVIGIRHSKWDERPLLIVVRKPGREPTKADILAFLRRQGRQMVDAGRRRLRRRNSPYRDRQDPEDNLARAIQGLSPADGLTDMTSFAFKPPLNGLSAGPG